MPSGVYKHKKGRHWKIQDTSRMKRRHPKSEFKVGHATWNKGKSLSEEHKAKLSEANMGHVAWNKGKKTGKHAWNYKGARSADYIERRLFRRAMQKQIFERDNYTCQLCGERGGDLQVDHIQSWAEYVELRFNIDNCRTLCAECHYKITYNRPMPENIQGWGHNLSKTGGERV